MRALERECDGETERVCVGGGGSKTQGDLERQAQTMLQECISEQDGNYARICERLRESKTKSERERVERACVLERERH